MTDDLRNSVRDFTIFSPSLFSRVSLVLNTMVRNIDVLICIEKRKTS